MIIEDIKLIEIKIRESFKLPLASPVQDAVMPLVGINPINIIPTNNSLAVLGSKNRKNSLPIKYAIKGEIIKLIPKLISMGFVLLRLLKTSITLKFIIIG